MTTRKRGQPIKAAPPADSDETMWVPIYRAIKDTTVHLIALNDSLDMFYVHYYNERTIPCIGKESGCVCKSVMLCKKWVGYLGAYDWQAGRRCLAEITVDAYRTAPHVFNQQQSLRGREFTLFRLVQRDNGPVRVCMANTVPDAVLEKLPPPLKVQKHLWKIWGIADTETT